MLINSSSDSATTATLAAQLTSEHSFPTSEIRPPLATLTVQGVTQPSAIGTYCWSEESKGLCADAIGLPTPQDALSTDSPTTATLFLPLATVPTELNLMIIPVTAVDEMQGNAQGYRWWNIQGGQYTELQLQTQQDFPIDLDPGLYVIGLSVWWESKGDVQYGFLLDVQ
jgi:hypothetical protein